ncbi:MAG: hypothetical protein JSR96_04000 [Proteobacteria bacterium]|nr:hypothetical protein [Pseudomonadota bacterium]
MSINRFAWRAIIAIVLVMAAMPARAEKLTFDHRLYPPLKAVLDNGDKDRIAYDASNPRYVVDLIAVTGKSASDWTEALEIIARSPAKGVRSARDWKAELEAKADHSCTAITAPIAEDASSLTFLRQLDGCPTARAAITYVRILGGKRSLFMLSVMFKTQPDRATMRQWLALLQSARIE